MDIQKDVKKHDLLKLVSGYAAKDHTKLDCFVCCILSHGTLGNIYGANGLMVAIKDIMMQFRPDFCPTLTGKPKLFFIQACQGKERLLGMALLSDNVIIGHWRPLHLALKSHWSNDDSLRDLKMSHLIGSKPTTNILYILAHDCYIYFSLYSPSSFQGRIWRKMPPPMVTLLAFLTNQIFSWGTPQFLALFRFGARNMGLGT